jgi:hypothetical protein
VRGVTLTLVGVLSASVVASVALSCLDPTRLVMAPGGPPTDIELAAACEATAPKGPELPTPLSIQLHTHGHSNHGSASRPSSMEFDAFQAKQYGVDAIVWSEHLSGFDQGDSVVIIPARGQLDVDSLNVTGLQTDATRLGAVRTGSGLVAARLSGSGLEFSAQNGAVGQPTRLQYFTQHIWSDGKARWPETLRFNRPVSSGAQVRLKYRFCGPAVDSVHFVARLSWHADAGDIEQQYQIHYVLTTNAVSESRSLEAARVVKVVRRVAPAGSVTLDLLSDASFLPDGDDNTLVDLSWYVESHDSTTHCVAVQAVVLTSASPTIDANWYQSQRFADRYRERFGVLGYVGFEEWTLDQVLKDAGFAQGGRAGAHMNVFVPASDPGSLFDLWGIGGRQLVRKAHELCGVVSINHPFGFALLSADTSGLGAIQAHVTGFLLNQRAFDADLLEVGLPARSGTVDQHLLMWDKLSAGGIRACGVGASDTHGWRWDDPGAPFNGTYTENHNPYVTWLWLRSTTRVGLVSALRRCRAYFGNPFVFHGTIDFRVDSVGAMGQSITAGTDSVSIRLAITGATGLDLWVVQGLMTPGPAVRYLRRERLAVATAILWVDTRRPSFVRFEIRRPDGTPAAFSNPVWLVK